MKYLAASRHSDRLLELGGGLQKALGRSVLHQSVSCAVIVDVGFGDGRTESEAKQQC